MGIIVIYCRSGRTASNFLRSLMLSSISDNFVLIRNKDRLLADLGTKQRHTTVAYIFQ